MYDCNHIDLKPPPIYVSSKKNPKNQTKPGEALSSCSDKPVQYILLTKWQSWYYITYF